MLRSLILACACLVSLVDSRRSDTSVSECTAEQLLGVRPDTSEVAAQRIVAPRTVSYAYEAGPEKWGFDLPVRISAEGRVECYEAGNIPFNDQRFRWLDTLKSWRYRPFERNGHAVAVIAIEHVVEEERAQTSIALPDVPLEQVRIQLERSGCFGECPAYKVSVSGDGNAIYIGKDYADVKGEHAFHVAPDAVQKLIDQLRRDDLWSLRPSYMARVTDSPSYTLTLRFGEMTHAIHDYVGEEGGMPARVTAFEKAVDAAARSDEWIKLGKYAVDRLADEHFDFTSRQAGDLLARALSHPDEKGDDGIVALITRGAPLDGNAEGRGDPGLPTMPAIEAALLNRHVQALPDLLSRSALRTDGRKDPRKLDAAFCAAVRGGRLSPLRTLWAYGGESHRPRLVCAEPYDHAPTPKYVPAASLLQRDSLDGGWEGDAIAKWLAEVGASPEQVVKARKK